jgi:23S rRNA pseudouridine2604 synthase
MPRSTLKLPKKPAPSTRPGDTRVPARKPLRSGSQTSKHGIPRRADGILAAPDSPTGKPGSTSKATVGVPSNSERATRQSEGMAGKAPPTGQNTDLHKPPVERHRGTADRATASTAADQPGHRLENGTIGERTTGDRPEKRLKTYPARGIARSTGVRAAPPAPRGADIEGPPAAPPQAHLPDAPPAAAASTNAPLATASAQRGLSKESPRLSKLVSELAVCSRRAADEWIENGWVSVDGVIVNRLGARVNPRAKIEIKEVAGKHHTESVTILFNKPCDPAAEPAEDAADTAMALIRPGNRWAEDITALAFKATHLRGLAFAGRLDGNEGGMLVFTQEGSVARRLTGKDSPLEKEYHVRVQGTLIPDGLELLRHGLSLEQVKLQRAQVSWLSEQQLRFVLHESRKRQIQGMCELVGLRATDIKRVRIGSVSLGKLPAGQWRYLREDERF